MRVLIIGAGVVGRCFAKAVKEQPAITHVTIADRDGARAQRIAAEIGADALTIDVEDDATMIAALARCEIVGSAVGPATCFALPLLEKVIRARKHFVDITDDPQPTLDMLALDPAARAAGATCIIGCGASPGITSMLAVVAADRVGQVDRLITAWGSGGSEADAITEDGGVTAAIEHWVEQISLPIRVWREGTLTVSLPLERVALRHPVLGKVVTRTVGHPEAVTLPLRYPMVRECLNVMDFSGYVFAALDDVASQVKSGRRTIREGAELLASRLDGKQFGAGQLLRYQRLSMRDRIAGKRYLPMLSALADGQRNGRAVTVSARLSGMIHGGMGPMTGVPAAIAVGMIASSKVKARGVFAPEAVLNPALFFAALRPHLRDSGDLAHHPSAPAFVLDERLH